MEEGEAADGRSRFVWHASVIRPRWQRRKAPSGVILLRFPQ